MTAPFGSVKLTFEIGRFRVPEAEAAMFSTMSTTWPLGMAF